MLTMAVGQSDDVDPAVAIAEAIDQCRATLDGRQPQAGILFIAFDSFDPALPDAVRSAFPGMALIGSTSGAEMSSAIGYLEDSVALAVFSSDDVDLAVGWGTGADIDAGRAARAAVTQALAATKLEPKVCIVLTESNTGQRVAEALREELPPDMLIVGGAAGRPEMAGTTFQFCGTEVANFGVAILILAGPVAYSSAVGTGWRTLGPSGTVTRSSYGQIHEIDGRPAADWVSGYLDLSSGGSTFGNPLAVRDGGVDEWYLRVVVAGDGAGSLAIPGAVPEGATVQLTTTNPDDMLQATSEAIQRARAAFPGSSPPTAALVFSCAVRKYLLGTRTGEEVESARSLLPDAMPIAGMYCIGEIAPTAADEDSHFLNETFVTLLLGT